ncbi:zeta toxin family protein [Streptomyces spirodelae]|uniref:UDP-N-acetylglucosamine kinase n=1 Tax=Streptomyces spirodelae TaxID=2812904 RepID=A0ABS3X2V2_9ACTN|nr:zeta toxin family protein [Streptomyces spirodelae]MBO8189707.1 zeta toxin family protein [Streptomyces spirodelae]
MAGEDSGRAGNFIALEDQTHVLAHLWRHPERVPEVLGVLTPDHFTAPGYEEFFRALTETHSGPVPDDGPERGAWRWQRWEQVNEELLGADIGGSDLDDVDNVRNLRPLETCVQGLVAQGEVRSAVGEHNAPTGPGPSLERAGDAVDRALPPRPSYPPPPAEPPEQPVVVVVAGAEGTGTGALTADITRQLTRRGAVVELGGGYPPSHPAYEAVEEVGLRPEARHLAAAQYAIDQRANTVLRTDARDPQALAEDMMRFQQAGYRVEFAAVTTPEPLRRLNALENHLSDRHTARLPFTPTPDRLAESANRAAAMGARVKVFRPDGTPVDSPGLAAGRQTPGQVIEAERERGLTGEMSLRAAAKAARIAARTTDWAHQAAAQEAGRAGGQNWEWAINAAVGLPVQPQGPRWGAGRRARAAGPLAARTDTELGELLESTMHRYRNADQKALHDYARGKELQDQGKPGAQAFFDSSQAARETANHYRDTVVGILGEERRRSTLSPRQRQAELQAVQQRMARVRPPAEPPRTAIGFAQPGRPRVAARR